MIANTWPCPLARHQSTTEHKAALIWSYRRWFNPHRRRVRRGSQHVFSYLGILFIYGAQYWYVRGWVCECVWVCVGVCGWVGVSVCVWVSNVLLSENPPAGVEDIRCQDVWGHVDGLCKWRCNRSRKAGTRFTQVTTMWPKSQHTCMATEKCYFYSPSVLSAIKLVLKVHFH